MTSAPKKTEIAPYNPRLGEILSLLEDHEYLTVKALSAALDVSMVTIRKDLTFLEQQGYLHRTHGGASKKSVYAFEKSVARKENINIEQKQRITREAVKQINENDCIILASGTTIHHLARQLFDFNKLTVLSASLRASLELCHAPGVLTIQIGGEVRKSSTSVVGTFAESVLSQFSCHKLFLGIDGISVDFGISTSNLAEAYLNQQMIRASEQVYVLGDSSKVGKRGFGRICAVDQVDVFITDEQISEKSVRMLEDAGVSVVIAA